MDWVRGADSECIQDEKESEGATMRGGKQGKIPGGKEAAAKRHVNVSGVGTENRDEDLNRKGKESSTKDSPAKIWAGREKEGYGRRPLGSGYVSLNSR